MDYSPEKYEAIWGHLPFWEDMDGFRIRVKIMESKFGKT
jgi:hypothetical protein